MSNAGIGYYCGPLEGHPQNCDCAWGYRCRYDREEPDEGVGCCSGGTCRNPYHAATPSEIMKAAIRLNAALYPCSYNKHHPGYCDWWVVGYDGLCEEHSS